MGRAKPLLRGRAAPSWPADRPCSTSLLHLQIKGSQVAEDAQEDLWLKLWKLGAEPGAFYRLCGSSDSQLSLTTVGHQLSPVARDSG